MGTTNKEIEKKGGGGKKISSIWNLGKGITLMFNFLFCKINSLTQWCFCVIMWLIDGSNMKFKCQCLYSIGF